MAGIHGRPRSALLAPFVKALRYQKIDLAMGFERMLPTGQTHLLVNLHENEFRTYAGTQVNKTHGVVLAAPHARSAVIDTAEQRCLVRVDFRLGGALAFFPQPLNGAANQFVELDQLWNGSAASLLRERLLEEPTPRLKLAVLEDFLLEHLNTAHNLDRRIPFAARSLELGASVADVTSSLGLLPKTFLRHFQRGVGLSPKRFARIRRLQRVLLAISPGGAIDWARVAAEHGYTDQAHLCHDFRKLTGISPSHYCPSQKGERNHVALQP